MRSPFHSAVRRADRLRFVVAPFLLGCALASRACFAGDGPPWLLAPLGFQAGDGPTAGVEFLSPEVVKLRTGEVEGTHARRLYTAPRDRFWNVVTGERLSGDPYDTTEPKFYDIDPENGRALVAGDLGVARLLELQSGVEIRATDFGGPVLECRFLAGTELAVAFVNKGQAQHAIVFQPESGETLWSDSDTDFRVRYRYIPAASKVLKQRPYYTASVGDTVSLTLHDAASGAVVGELEEVVQQLTVMRSLRASEQPLLAGVRSGAGTQRIMNLATGAVFEVSGLAGASLYVELSSDWKRFILFQPDDKRLTTRDAETGELLADLGASRTAQGYGPVVGWFGFSADGDSVFAADAQPSLTEWQTEGGALVHSTPMVDDAVAVSVIGPADDGFIAISEEGNISIRNRDTGEEYAELGEVRFGPSIAFSPEASRLVLAEPGGRTRVYAYPSGEELLGLPAGKGLALASGYVVANDGFLICYHHGLVEERDAQTFELRRVGQLPRFAGEPVVIDPVGGRLLLTKVEVAARAAILYDPFTQESTPLGSPPIEGFSAADLISVDDRVVIALSRGVVEDGAVKRYIEVYDESGARTQVAEIGFEATLLRLASSSGIVAFSVDDDQTYPGSAPIGFMDVETGVVIQPENLPGRVADLRFEPDGLACWALWNEGGSSLRLSRIDPRTGETIGDLLTIANSPSDSGWFLGRLTLLTGGEQAVISTADSRLMIIDLVTGETLAETRARPAPSQVYDVLPALQQVSVSAAGDRLLYQDVQGLVDAWRADQGEAISLTIFPSPAGPRLSFEAEAGFEYLIEQSADLSVWRSLDSPEGDDATPGEASLPLGSDGATFARGFRFATPDAAPSP